MPKHTFLFDFYYLMIKSTSNVRVHALKLARKYGLEYINGYDHPNILAGTGCQNNNVLYTYFTRIYTIPYGEFKRLD